MTARRILAAVAGASGAWLAAAAADAPPGICAPGTTIGQIVVERVNVFDPSVPGEEKWAFRAVNVLHSPMLTRERTVRLILPLHVGDPCSPERLEEAERELRARDFLQDAWVEAADRDGDTVTVVVRVRDAWSTGLRFSWSSQGGAEQRVFRIEESNLFGTGTELSFEDRANQDRTERTFEMVAPALLGHGLVIDLVSSDNSDGKAQVIGLGRPFLSLGSRWAGQVRYEDYTRVEKVYVGPVIVDRWRGDERFGLLEAGFSPGLRGDTLHRYWIDLRQIERQWALEAEGEPVRPDLAPRSLEQTLAGFRYEWQRVDFRREHFLNHAGRVEDFDVGTRVRFRTSVALPGLSADSGGAFAIDARRGHDLGRGRYLVLAGGYSFGRLGAETVDSIASVDVSFWNRVPSRRQTTFVRLYAANGYHVEGPSRFLLGADTGLRGYRSRAFSGENLFLFNAEHRFFGSRELLHLVRAGFVVFGEVGGAWDGPIDWSVLHPAVGVGLRLGILRSSAGATLHLNAGFPLDPNGDPGNDGVRFSFLTVTGF